MADTRNAVRRDVGDVYSDVLNMDDEQLLEVGKALFTLRTLLRVSNEQVHAVLAFGIEALCNMLIGFDFDGIGEAIEGDELTVWIALVSSMVNHELAERRIPMEVGCDDEA